jgi:hypothetical protein
MLTVVQQDRVEIARAWNLAVGGSIYRESNGDARASR